MPQTLNCPHCPARPLFVETRGNVSLHACGHCGGLWIDNELATRIVLQIVPEAITLADRASQHASPFPPLAPTPACPVCAAALTRTRLADAAIELDICTPHGTWFDREELQVVARHFEQRRAKAPLFPAPLRFNPADYPGAERSESTLGAVGVGVAEGLLEFMFETVVDAIVD